jgi:hypothetical protein
MTEIIWHLVNTKQCHFASALHFLKDEYPSFDMFVQLIRPICITILYHDLLLLIDIFHI